MSRVSISRSCAVLAGLETYTKATSKVKSAEKAAKHQKDKLLHPGKVRQQEEAKKDKLESAEKERQPLAGLRAEQETTKSEKSMSGRFSRIVQRFKGNKAETTKSAVGTRRASEGPEDGIPAPEGKR